MRLRADDRLPNQWPEATGLGVARGVSPRRLPARLVSGVRGARPTASAECRCAWTPPVPPVPDRPWTFLCVRPSPSARSFWGPPPSMARARSVSDGPRTAMVLATGCFRSAVIVNAVPANTCSRAFWVCVSLLLLGKHLGVDVLHHQMYL